MTVKPSACPTVKLPTALSSFSCPSTITVCRRGDRTPPWGQPLVVEPLAIPSRRVHSSASPFKYHRFYTMIYCGCFYRCNWGFVADCLCGLVVRVLGYRSGAPGSIPGTTRKKK
jgi:hypothetical protein